MSEDVLLPGLESYLEGLLPKRDPVLADMEIYAEKNRFPIVGPLVGQFLMQYARFIRPKRILELGSGFGYSALWFAKGAPEDVEIICTDFSTDNVERANSYFERAKVGGKIRFLVGDGLELLEKLEGEFDIIFNDVEKEDYPKVFKTAIPRLRKGGALMTDNALWHGRVIETSSVDPATSGAREYNRLAFNDPRVLSTIVPIRDGLAVSVKL
ncbi:MAG: O-methyltransferase [Candidatus Hodarchaeales archaeon]|jgi:predicted O-methyltransferase YrrM